jgi:uncharacterized damage-inducible protein DinB
MKELLQQYSSYNVWATQKIFVSLKPSTDEQLHTETESSFSSIFKTVLHLWDAESIWWQRLKLQEHVDVPSNSFSGDFEELQKKALAQSALWDEWVANATEPQLQHVFAYQNSKKEQFKQPVWQMLLHLFNHGTYHRGQLVTMMRRLGIDKLPQTDFIVFSRMKK